LLVEELNQKLSMKSKLLSLKGRLNMRRKK
jgi:hypothetical protein